MNKKFKHGRELRKHWRLLQRQYRAKKKVREAQAAQTEAPLTCQPPIEKVSQYEGKRKTT